MRFFRRDRLDDPLTSGRAGHRDSRSAASSETPATEIRATGVPSDDDSQRAAQLRVSWRRSPELRRSLLAGGVAIAAVIIATAVGAAVGATTATYSEDRDMNAIIGAVFGAGIVGYLSALGWLVHRRQQRRSWYDRVILLQAHAELSRAESKAANDELDLSSLWALTQQRLDYYHGLATSQAEKSFTYGLVAAGLGFFVILAASIAAALGNSAAASVSAALVGLAGGGLSAYIGATFMRLQENSATQLRAYFSQPLEFSRFLAAERLLTQLDPADNAAATRDLIRALADTRPIADGSSSS